MVKDYGGFFTPLDSKPLKMGGVSNLKTQKKTQFWWGHPCNPKP